MVIEICTGNLTSSTLNDKFIGAAIPTTTKQRHARIKIYQLLNVQRWTNSQQRYDEKVLYCPEIKSQNQCN
jgi:hypothetical protein